MNRKETGILGEKLAGDYLKKHGYKIIETNYRCPQGEIDIVAKHKEFLVFVEVRTKTSTGYGGPGESINAGKRERMRANAYYYCQEHEKLPPSWRIDVVSVEIAGDRKPVIELIQNAVGEE